MNNPDRPMLLLDVDGVLNAFPSAGDRRVPYKRTVVSGYTITYRPVWARWVQDMSIHADPIWATMWQDAAVEHFAPRTGIGTGIDRYIDFHAYQRRTRDLRMGSGVGSYKHPGVIGTVGDRPFVWIDDDLEPDQHDWAWERNRTIPTLLVQPDRRVGLTRDHVAEVSEFMLRASRVAA